MQCRRRNPICFTLCTHLLLTLALFAGPGGRVAKAAELTKEQKAAARKAYGEGQAHMKAKRWAEAVVAFKKAYDVTKDGVVMGQVAAAYAKAGDYEAALEAIKVYREAVSASDRKSADALIEEYKKKVAAGKSKHLVLPGEEPAKAPATKKEDTTEGMPPAGGQPEAGGGGGGGLDQPVVQQKKGRFWTWVALGAAGALTISALVVGLSAQSKYDELHEGCGATAGGCEESEIDSVKTRAIAADVLWGTAAAAAITAGVLFFVEGRGGGEKKKDFEDEMDEELVQDLQVSPIFSKGTYGVGASFRY